jgi:hypothetical protein
MAESGSTLSTCLNEIDRCRPFFVGFLGTRYGWRPDSYASALKDDDDESPLAWLASYPERRSVTELEFQHGALRAPQHARACFYIRDQRFMHDVPTELQSRFAPADRDAYEQLEALKSAVRDAHRAHPDRVRLFDQYPASVDHASLHPDAAAVQAGAMPRVTGLLICSFCDQFSRIFFESNRLGCIGRAIDRRSVGEHRGVVPAVGRAAAIAAVDRSGAHCRTSRARGSVASSRRRSHRSSSCKHPFVALISCICVCLNTYV